MRIFSFVLCYFIIFSKSTLWYFSFFWNTMEKPATLCVVQNKLSVCNLFYEHIMPHHVSDPPTHELAEGHKANCKGRRLKWWQRCSLALDHPLTASITASLQNQRDKPARKPASFLASQCTCIFDDGQSFSCLQVKGKPGVLVSA